MNHFPWHTGRLLRPLSWPLFIFVTGFFSILSCSSSLAQYFPADSLIQEGIAAHDRGQYREAIADYKAALHSDPGSSQAAYELSYTYFTTRDFDNAIKYAKQSLKKGRKKIPEAYVIWGSALDELGHEKKSLALFNEGIADFPDFYLLEYNKGLTLYRMKKYPMAESSLIRAVTLKPGHPSSHLLLAYTEASLENRVKSILPLYFFLLLEPESDRSVKAWDFLVTMQTQGVLKKDHQPIEIGLTQKGSGDSDSLRAIDLAISMATVASMTQSSDTTELGRFSERNRSVFAVLSEIKCNQQDIWWTFYIPFFKGLFTSGNVLSYSYYISRSARSEETLEWIKKHPLEMDHLATWLNQQEFLQ